MRTIYGIRGLHVARVRASLLKKGLEFNHVSVDLGNKSDEFKKLTPVDKIPVLEDEDGTVIWDSVHIAEYLDKKYPETYSMMGRDVKEKVKILNVIALVERMTEYLEPFYFEKFDMVQKMKDSGASFRARVYDEQQKKEVKKDIEYRMARLKEMLGENDHFTGQYSLADAAAFSAMSTLEFVGIDVSSWKDWTGMLMKDESVAKMFAGDEEKGIKEI